VDYESLTDPKVHSVPCTHMHAHMHDHMHSLKHTYPFQINSWKIHVTVKGKYRYLWYHHTLVCGQIESERKVVMTDDKSEPPNFV
jgi:hypothetical protein